MTIGQLESAIVNDLRQELGIEENSDDINVLSVKVSSAVRTVKRARNYLPTHTQGFIESDIVQFRENIHDLALYNFNQIGVEGQLAHNENSISRTWKDPKECLNGVVPFVKAL